MNWRGKYIGKELVKSEAIKDPGTKNMKEIKIEMF